mmetsp:Transcript_16384/g.57341  ORF Transcript_16384/g.57341 Transcript_16384/m.57341 type:complete len:200 (-) Transcript_16384:181-780(-)
MAARMAAVAAVRGASAARVARPGASAFAVSTAGVRRLATAAAARAPPSGGSARGDRASSSRRVVQGGAAMAFAGGVAVAARARAMSSAAASAAEDPWAEVSKAIEAGGPVLISKTTCGYCARVKRVLADMGVWDRVRVFELDYELDRGASVQRNTASLYGISTVPQLYVGGRLVGDSQDVMEAWQSGELETLLAGDDDA